MNLNVSDICEQVRITLDQNQVEDGIFENDEATLELDDIIEQKILQAAQQILLEAPLPWIDTTTSFISAMSPTFRNNRFSMTLPSDFLRFAYAKASDWKVPVRVVVTDLDDDYHKVNSSFAGIRPNCSRPMVVITSEKSKTIEFYGSKESEGAVPTLTKAEYIAMPKIEDGVLAFPEKLKTALYYLTAAYVALTYKDQAAQSLFAAARSYMGIPEQPQQPVKK